MSGTPAYQAAVRVEEATSIASGAGPHRDLPIRAALDLHDVKITDAQDRPVTNQHPVRDLQELPQLARHRQLFSPPERHDRPRGRRPTPGRDLQRREQGGCGQAAHTFATEYGAKWPKAVAKIVSTFATVGLRTRVTKGPGSRAAGVAMAFKIIKSAQARWRAVNAPPWSRW